MSNEMVLKIAKLPQLKYMHDYRNIYICKYEYAMTNTIFIKYPKMPYI